MNQPSVFMFEFGHNRPPTASPFDLPVTLQTICFIFVIIL